MRYGQKTLTVIVNIIFISLFLSTVPTPSNANPIPVDNNNDMEPLPYERTSVYLATERIEVTFDNKQANVKATYTFTNIDNNRTALSILLPFKSKPSDIEISIEDEELPFSWLTSEQYFHFMNDYANFSIALGKKLISIGSCDTIFFTVEFPPMTSKSVIATYNRDYVIYDAPEYGNKEIYYNFVYIYGTAVYWNHSIDKAEFIFRVPEEMTDGAGSFYDDVTFEDGYYVVKMTYEDWTVDPIDGGLIYFFWNKNRPDTIKEDPTFHAVIALIIIVILIIVFIIKLKQKSDR
jgi:hypothetical protein